MSPMQLTLREAASYLNVPESTVRRWVSTRGLPAHRVNERLHCNAIELWEWALENGIAVSRSLLEQAQRVPEAVPPLSALLAAGGVHRDVAGGSRPEVLREVVRVLPLPPDVDRDFLADVLEAREAMGSTGVGDGIAIPHVRNPILLHVTRPFVSLCLLRHPVEFDAVDGLPVHALFVVVSPNVPAHLRILAQLGFVLRDEELRRLLRSAQPAEAILARLAVLEAGARRVASGEAAGGPA
ncbi:MAG TPA: PTS sugar transporter subunit IIA [Longimicrobiales bacterium]|nr:PTS sugar transporter subunit IIA [Longimicrobiales bacterium]